MFFFIWLIKKLEKINNPASVEEHLLEMEKRQRQHQKKIPPPDPK